METQAPIDILIEDGQIDAFLGYIENKDKLKNVIFLFNLVDVNSNCKEILKKYVKEERFDIVTYALRALLKTGEVDFVLNYLEKKYLEILESEYKLHILDIIEYLLMDVGDNTVLEKLTKKITKDAISFFKEGEEGYILINEYHVKFFGQK